MLRPPAFYPLAALLGKRLPLQGPVLAALTLFVIGTIASDNGCLDTVAAHLALYGNFHTLRRQLRELTYNDAERIASWGPDTELEVGSLFPHLYHFAIIGSCPTSHQWQ